MHEYLAFLVARDQTLAVSALPDAPQVPVDDAAAGMRHRLAGTLRRLADVLEPIQAVEPVKTPARRPSPAPRLS